MLAEPTLGLAGAVTAAPPPLKVRLVVALAGLWVRARPLWWLWVLLAAAGWTAGHYLAFNWTDSMPQRLVWLEYGVLPARGDLIVLRADPHGPLGARLRGTRWLKNVRGMPGDRVTVVGREVFVNGTSMGVAAEQTGSGKPLQVIEPGVIPPGSFYVAGRSVDSLDSRYALVGLIRNDQLLARAHTIF